MNTTNISNTAAQLAGKTYIAIALISYIIPWTIVCTLKLLQRTKAKFFSLGRKLKHQN
ncbi:MAG: hypothetical protein ABNH02_07320 [Pseudomonadales bacterium]